jgi:hypothetical protein
MSEIKLENYKILYEFLKEEAQEAHGHLPEGCKSKSYDDYIVLCVKRDRAKKMFIDKMNEFLSAQLTTPTKDMHTTFAGFHIDYPPLLGEALK